VTRPSTFCGATPARDYLRGLQAPATDEHCQPSKDDLLRWRERPVAPVERGSHRLVDIRRRPTTAGQQPERVVQPLQDLQHPERTHPRRVKFDRQGQTLDSRTDATSTGAAGRVTPKFDWTA
jgi:hypothetical protein